MVNNKGRKDILERSKDDKKGLKKNGICLLILLLHSDTPYLLYFGRRKSLLTSDSSACLVLLLPHALLDSLIRLHVFKVKDWILVNF